MLPVEQGRYGSICLKLMNMRLCAKYCDYSVLLFQPLQIKSAIAVEGLKGYIYVEAFKQQHVKQAIEDIGNLRIGRWQQLMVPIREMTDVMRVVKDTTGLKQGSWVRIKRGMYKDDIAQVGSFYDWSIVRDLHVVWVKPLHILNFTHIWRVCVCLHDHHTNDCIVYLLKCVIFLTWLGVHVSLLLLTHCCSDCTFSPCFCVAMTIL